MSKCNGNYKNHNWMNFFVMKVEKRILKLEKCQQVQSSKSIHMCMKQIPGVVPKCHWPRVRAIIPTLLPFWEQQPHLDFWELHVLKVEKRILKHVWCTKFEPIFAQILRPVYEFYSNFGSRAATPSAARNGQFWNEDDRWKLASNHSRSLDRSRCTSSASGIPQAVKFGAMQKQSCGIKYYSFPCKGWVCSSEIQIKFRGS
mgnify:CR=1 FL=1